jgi:hypothetical protein
MVVDRGRERGAYASPKATFVYGKYVNIGTIRILHPSMEEFDVFNILICFKHKRLGWIL